MEVAVHGYGRDEAVWFGEEVELFSESPQLEGEIMVGGRLVRFDQSLDSWKEHWRMIAAKGGETFGSGPVFVENLPSTSEVKRNGIEVNKKLLKTLRKKLLATSLTSEVELLSLVSEFGFPNSKGRRLSCWGRLVGDEQRQVEPLEQIIRSLELFRAADRLLELVRENVNSIRVQSNETGEFLIFGERGAIVAEENLDALREHAWLEGLPWTEPRLGLDFYPVSDGNRIKAAWSALAHLINEGFRTNGAQTLLEWDDSQASIAVQSVSLGFLGHLWHDMVQEITGLKHIHCELCGMDIWRQRSTRKWCRNCKQTNYDRKKRREVKI